MAPVTFALFTVAIAWPLQSALQKRIPVLLALVVTIVVTLAVLAILIFLVVWGFGLVFQWVINNTDRIQTLYAQATEWLDSHGVSITNLVADSYNPGWIIGAIREVGGRSYGLVSFIVIAFAFIVLGLLEVDIARRNVEHLNSQSLRRSLLQGAEKIADKFQKYMVVRTTMSLLTGVVVWSFALVAGIELASLGRDRLCSELHSFYRPVYRNRIPHAFRTRPNRLVAGLLCRICMSEYHPVRDWQLSRTENCRCGFVNVSVCCSARSIFLEFSLGDRRRFYWPANHDCDLDDLRAAQID
ncbi:MAG: hypothetical protein WCD78_07930 [Pseudolabrys sp.]